MPKARADRMSDILAALEKAGGRTPRIKSDLALDQLVALMFARHATPPQATKSVQALREEFVDWNEVRISYVREIIKPLEAENLPEPKARARELIDLLERLYRDHNAVNLDFLAVEDLNLEEAFNYTKDLPGVGDAAAAGIVIHHAEEGKAIAAAEILRVPGRLGLAGKSPTPARIRKVLEDSLQGKDRIRAHYLFARLAAELCVSRNPHCMECPLAKKCEYGQAQLKAGKGQPRAEEPEAPPAPPKPKSVAKKQPAAKKPAAKKSAAKVPAAKKPAVKTSAAKKPAAKTSAAKKSAARKPAAKKKPATGKKAAAKKRAVRKKK